MSLKHDQPTDGHAFGVPRPSRISKDEELAPWVRARTLDDTFLYWMPVSSYPMQHGQKEWLYTFMERWSSVLQTEQGLRPELFLQYGSVDEQLSPDFQRYALKSQVLTGVSRRPGMDLPTFPPAEEMKRIFNSGETFDVEDWVAEYCYWFMSKEPEEQRGLFGGRGGMTTVFLPPDAATKPPRLPFTPKFRAAMPVFQHANVDAVVAGAFALKDPFLQRSKQVFGAGLEDEPIYPGIAFVLPMLTSGHFFAATPEDRALWFSIFDVYVNESPADNGIILAFQKDMEDLLQDVLRAMQADGLKYPTAQRGAM